MPPPPSPPNTHPHKPRPAYFLVRPNRQMVPLIAIDELPPSLSIAGLQRCLEPEDTVGMLNLGMQKGSGGYYHVVQEEDEDIKTASTIPRATKPTQIRETNLCRHWCTHGICKWNQQCRYKHTMPLSLSGLSDVGLTDWPLWFRTLNPGFFVSSMKGGRLQRSSNPAPPPSTSHSSRVNHAEARLGKKEESLGEQIIERFRVMEREKGVKGRGSVQAPRLNNREEKRGKSVSVSVAVERAAARDARRWGDESESGGTVEGSEGSGGESSGSEEVTIVKREGLQLKGKLVDV